ncbi:MAG: phospholipase D-like domain-containing protein [Mycobacterium leprae]
MGTEGNLVLTEVYCCEQPGREYVRLWNSGTVPAGLTDYRLEWDGRLYRFPDTAAPLAPGEGLYVAKEPNAFRQVMTQFPQFGLKPVPEVPSLIDEDEPPTPLSPKGGSIRLLMNGGHVADAFVWGDGSVPNGWTGPGILPPDADRVFLRAIDESTLSGQCSGRYVMPGGTAAVWHQGTSWVPRRIMQLGQASFPYPTYDDVKAITAFTSPDCACSALTTFIDSAVSQLDINIYLFTQDALIGRLEAALARRVPIRLLMEGEPMSGMAPGDRKALDRLRERGAQVRVLRRTPDGFKRYHLDHAKFAIADGSRALIMSDNWTHTSAPDTPKTGNRGWGVIVESPGLSAHLTRVFAFDWNPHSPDSVDLEPKVQLPVMAASPADMPEPMALGEPFVPVHMNGPMAVTPVLAPEHAMLETCGITGLIRSATTHLEIEQQDVPLYWGGQEEDRSTDATPNLFLEETLAAARRGVQVRILLGGQYLEPDNPVDNSKTREYLRRLAEQEHLPLQCRIVDYGATGMGIHNKGIMVDGKSTCVSSINWTENSPLYNRELGLILHSPEVTSYFGRIFERDWGWGK